MLQKLPDQLHDGSLQPKRANSLWRAAQGPQKLHQATLVSPIPVLHAKAWMVRWQVYIGLMPEQLLSSTWYGKCAHTWPGCKHECHQHLMCLQHAIHRTTPGKRLTTPATS